MSKIKTISFDGQRFNIVSEVIGENSSKSFTGIPAVAAFPDYVQIGCMRITKQAIKEINMFLYAVEDTNIPEVFQLGNYETKDPNTSCLTFEDKLALDKL